MRAVIGVAGTAAAMVALYRHPLGGAAMVGFMPPHYGYTAYFESAAVLCGFWPEAQGLCLLALLLSTNRCAWVGLIAGWGYLGGRRRWALAGILAILAVGVGGWIKPSPYNDTVRIDIWRAAVASPGIGGRTFAATVVDGRPVEKAHSDLLQLFVVGGSPLLVLVVVWLAQGLVFLMLGERTEATAVVICLSVQSVFDNRLHYPPCFALYALAWYWAVTERMMQPGLIGFE